MLHTSIHTVVISSLWVNYESTVYVPPWGLGSSRGLLLWWCPGESETWNNCSRQPFTTCQHVNMSQHLRQISRLSAPSRNSTVAIDMALGYAFGRNLGMGVAALRCRSDVSESFRWLLIRGVWYLVIGPEGRHRSPLHKILKAFFLIFLQLECSTALSVHFM